MSNWMLSQQQSTQNTNKVEIPASQVTELYKIVKQNSYLKSRTSSAEKALKEAENLLKQKESLLLKKDEAIKISQNQLIGLEQEHSKEIEIREIQVKNLSLSLQALREKSVKERRKKFLQGTGLGIILGGAIASLILL